MFTYLLKETRVILTLVGYTSIMRVQWNQITASLVWQLSLTLKLTAKQNNEDIMFCMKFSGALVMETIII